MNQKPQTRPVIGPGGRPGGGGGPMGARMNVQKPKHLWKTIRRLFGYLGHSRNALFGLLGVMLTVTVLDLAGPALQGAAIDTIAYDAELGRFTVDFPRLFTLLVSMAAIFLCSSVLTYFQGRLAARLSQNTVHTLRTDLFAKITRLPISYTDTHKHGDLMSRMTNDVENVSNTVAQSIASLFSSVLTIIGALIMMLRYSWFMTLIAFITIPLTIFVSSSLSKFMRKYFVEQQKLLGALNGQVEEMVTGYKTVIAYGREGESVSRFREISRQLRHVAIRARIWGGVMGPCMNIIGNLNYLLIATFGGIFICNPVPWVRISIGNIQSILQYSKKFSRPINEIANQYAQILTAIAGAERIFEIIDSPDEIDAGRRELPPSAVRGNIDFRHVKFSYVEGEPVLTDFDLRVEAGQKIAIVGATGSGKTTVVNLLTRFYEIDGGAILLDGVDIRDIPKDDLRRSIGIVLQDTVLFSDTIRANIKYGRLEATDEEMRAAADTANADIFIERIPTGYDTQLAEAGSNLSQGQRQLLAIARAVLADPKILILDEATSSVDTRTEMQIQQAMVALMENRTSLIIAHRLSTIRDADKIIVLKGGVICESGSHEELLAMGGEYAALYRNQFAGFAT
ncbi:MAG: ABC transporter ATP-binding protein [Clostridia bacterium]|nr:ABC transporter ATP-binding protein [Clostridia bacterium]